MITTVDVETSWQVTSTGGYDPSPFHPDNILVSVGINDEYLLQRFLPTDQMESIKICKGIKRTNGDNYRCSQGEELLDQAIEEFFKS